MTVAGLIEQYDIERPNQIESSVKADFLRKCEAIIIEQVIKTHEEAPEDIDEHINNFDMNTELLVKEPYDDVYIYYLDQRIAYNNNDMKRYNAASTMYNNALFTYQQWYNRNFTPVKKRNRYYIRHEVI